ncbi:MAG: glycosyltransferase family 39 protein [Bacteroidota bacterium]
MTKKEIRRSSSEKNQQKEISVFPFFRMQLQHRFAGAVIALVYAAAMLFIGLTYHIVGDYHVETDFFQAYVPTAKDILRGVWTIEDFRGPAYPALLAVFGGIFKDFFSAGIILSTLSASLTMFFIFELVRRLFRVDIAFIVVLLTGVNKTFVQYAYTAGTDMVFNMFAITALFFLLYDRQKNWLNIGLAALCAAAAYLTRYNGIFVIAAIPLMIIIFDIYSIPVKQRIVTAAVFIGLFMVFITPWGIHSLNEKGNFFYNKNYLNIAYEMFAKGRIGWDQYWNVEASKYGSLTAVIIADPGLFIATVAKNFYDHLISDMQLLVHWGIGIGFLAGLVAMFKQRPDPRQASFYFYGALMFLVLLLVFYGERFSMFLIPVYSTLAVSTLTWNRWRGIPFYNGTLVALALVVWSFTVSYDFNRQNIDSGPKEITVIADWFNANVRDTDETNSVVCRKPHIAYYIGKTMKYFPYVDTWEDLESEIQNMGATYLFYGIYEANMRPQFQQLLNPNTAPEWLEPITYTQNPPSVLYRVKVKE